jgi:hypothetical protein
MTPEMLRKLAMVVAVLVIVYGALVFIGVLPG